MRFNIHNADDIFRALFSEEKIKQDEEIKKITDDSQSQIATNPGKCLKALTDVYEKHLNVRVGIFISALLKLPSAVKPITARNEKDLIKTLSEFIDSFFNYTGSSLKFVLDPSVTNNSVILSENLKALKPKFNDIKRIQTKYLEQLIGKHNEAALVIKKNIKFWNSKSGMVTAFATVIIMVFVVLEKLDFFQEEVSEYIPAIHSFEVSLEEITKGQAINLLWNVGGADSVTLNYNIGKVSFSGSQLIYPNTSTIFILSAFLDNKVLSITKKVTVKDSLGNAL